MTNARTFATKQLPMERDYKKLLSEAKTEEEYSELYADWVIDFNGSLMDENRNGNMGNESKNGVIQLEEGAPAFLINPEQNNSPS